MNIEDVDGVKVLHLTGGSAAKSFSREFLPKIADAVNSLMGE